MQRGLWAQKSAEIIATIPINTGQTLWKERAIRRNRTLEGLQVNAHLSLPCASEKALQCVRSLPIENGYGLFLNISMVKQSKDGNMTYQIEDGPHETFLLAVATRDIEAGETLMVA
ncbi:MAG: hypothetical protein CMP20_15845 [Rickettsiales bacterium]|nr:hypothetical protein [Rickettsiales bacterium]